MSDENDFCYASQTVPPGAVFVAYDDPARVFPSVAAAERELATIGLENDAYPAAYGPKGEVYSVRCEPGRVIIERSDEPNRPEELKHLLLHYLECCEDPGDATEALERLVDEAWSVERDYWQRNQPNGGAGISHASGWNWLAAFVLLAAVVYLLFRLLR